MIRFEVAMLLHVSLLVQKQGMSILTQKQSLKTLVILGHSLSYKIPAFICLYIVTGDRHHLVQKWGAEDSVRQIPTHTAPYLHFSLFSNL